MPQKFMPFCLLMMGALLSSTLLVTPWHSPTVAQTDTVPITLLYPDDISGNRDEFTIRPDDQTDRLNLSTLNFRWNDGSTERRFNLGDQVQIRSVVQSLETGQCIQLYLVVPNNTVPLCDPVYPYPISSAQVFWQPQTITFSAYQGDTRLATCSTTADSCTFNWPISAPLTTTPPPTETPTPIIVTATLTPTLAHINFPQPTLILYATDNSLTLYINSDDPVSLVGMRYQTIINANSDERFTYVLGDWDALSLTDQIAQPHTCYILERQNSTDPLPIACQGGPYRLVLSNANIFWYDSNTRSRRSVAILAGDTRIQICPASDVGCEITYISATANDAWQPILRTFSGIEMALVPSGCFMMGFEGYYENETPVHEQCLDAPYWIDRTEVTRAHYNACVTAGACTEPPASDYSNRADQPINRVTWLQARDYCTWRESRLPSEREWEYAVRGPDNLIYPWGNEFVDDNVVYWENSSNTSADVGSRPSGVSWVGAYDMSGNVSEWVSSLYRNYEYNADDGRENLENSTDNRVLRGGSFNLDPPDVRTAARYESAPDEVYEFGGFRCARDFAASDLNGQ